MSCPKEHRILNYLILQGIFPEGFSLIWTSEDICGGFQDVRPLLLLIDEFPSLNRMEIFADALSYMAGYGIKAYLITQDIRQIVEAYGPNESIVSNCHVRVAFAPNQYDTAELLSKMTGTMTVQKASYNFSGSRFAPIMGHVNASVDHIERALMTPDEIMRRARLVEFCPSEPYATLARSRRYRGPGACSDGAMPLMKPVVAATGDLVEVSSPRNRGKRGITSAGRIAPALRCRWLHTRCAADLPRSASAEPRRRHSNGWTQPTRPLLQLLLSMRL